MNISLWKGIIFALTLNMRIFADVPPGVVFHADGKVSVLTTKNRKFERCRVTKVEPDGITLSFVQINTGEDGKPKVSAGVVKVVFEELHKDAQVKYKYVKEDALAYVNNKKRELQEKVENEARMAEYEKEKEMAVKIVRDEIAAKNRQLWSCKDCNSTGKAYEYMERINLDGGSSYGAGAFAKTLGGSMTVTLQRPTPIYSNQKPVACERCSGSGYRQPCTQCGGSGQIKGRMKNMEEDHPPSRCPECAGKG